MNNKVVIFILDSTGLGGAEKQAVILAEALSLNMFMCKFVLFGNQEGAATVLLKEKGLEYVIFPSICKQFTLKPFWLIRFKLFLNKLKGDILMPYTYGPNKLVSLLYLLSIKKPTIIWNQRDEGFGIKVNSLLKITIQRSVKHYIANSRGAKKYLLSELDVPESKISVIYNGVRIKMPSLSKDEWRKRNGFKTESFLVCMIANIHHNKDHKTLVKAFKIFHDDVKDSFLIFVGKKYDEYENLILLIKSLDLEGSILFLNEIKDIENVLNSTDLKVLSSRSEGLPNSIIEAMKIGTPVTGTDVPGIVEALGIEYSKYLARPSNVEELSSRLLYFYKNKERVKDLVIKNKSRAELLFSIEKLVEETVKCLNQQ